MPSEAGLCSAIVDVIVIEEVWYAKEGERETERDRERHGKRERERERSSGRERERASERKRNSVCHLSLA